MEEGAAGAGVKRPSGLAHIIDRHGDEFAKKGISEVEIPDVSTRAIQEGKVVGFQGKGTARPIYEFEYEGKALKLAITIGDNGYIVGANFSK